MLPGEKYIDYANRFSVTTVSTSSASIQVRVLIPSLNAPTLAFVTPTDGTVVTGLVPISIDGLDRNGISKIQLSKDGSVIATETAAPYQFSWDTTMEAFGTHTLTATVYNTANVSASASVTVTVRKPPVVAITNPVDKTQFTAVPSVTLTATVTTDNAGVHSLQFFQNGTALGTGSSNGTGAYSFTWTGVSGGTYAITAVATDTNGLTATSAPITISVHNPVISQAGVVNAASLGKGQPITAGSLVSVFGSDLAQSTISADSVPLPLGLSGASLTFNGVTGPVMFVSPTQINAQVPWELSGPSAAVVVTRDGIASPPLTVLLSPASPAIFSTQYGVGQAIAVNQDGTLAAPENSIAGLTTHPAAPGDALIV